MDRGAWWAIVHAVVKESDATEHTRAHTHIHSIHLHMVLRFCFNCTLITSYLVLLIQEGQLKT